MANHLTIGVYPNGQWKYNIVSEEDLEGHIEYNKTWRFGRLLYVDGVRVYDGCIKKDALEFYDAIEKQARASILDGKDIQRCRPTIPYC